ncbi:hypothetical protein MHH52_06965 [Paenibacillus sp. FSL K6-0276]|uniref:hypothetical protein n=1 Tax=Paenibacillus sp. FSL K6-0276 TaxID=2921450 RepID=UPI0030EB48C3
MTNQLFDQFIEVAERLNRRFNITPLLYGSLGLVNITGIDFTPQDIDVLIPQEYLNEKWNEFKQEIEDLGYELIDLHEHEFYKNQHKIAFALIEGLWDFAGIDHNQIEMRVNKNTKYKILNLREYLQVYQRSSTDGYRKTNHLWCGACAACVANGAV